VVVSHKREIEKYSSDLVKRGLELANRLNYPEAEMFRGDSQCTEKMRKSTDRGGETDSFTDKCDLLIVEDEQEFRDFIGLLIQRNFPKLKIQFAGDGLEGIKKVKALKPHIVWTCLKMPCMDGLELIELIRRNPSLKNTKIIVCTYYDSKDIRNRAFELGADRFLNKPIAHKEVLSAIDSCFMVGSGE